MELGSGGGRRFRPVRDMQPLHLVRHHHRQHPVQAAAPVTAGGRHHSAHPPQQAHLANILDFGAGGLVRPCGGEISYQQHHQPARDVRLAGRRPPGEASLPGDGHHQ
ncbi:MAG: hypothetical protein ACK55Z_07950, partial [bacterium]